MHIRIDPVAGDAPIRLLRVESIQPQGRDAEQRETPDRQERAATYAPAPEEETGAYAPTADGPRPAEPVALDGGFAARAAEPLLPPAPTAPPVPAAEPPVLAPAPLPTPDEEERSLYPSGTPAWMTALLKAR